MIVPHSQFSQLGQRSCTLKDELAKLTIASDGVPSTLATSLFVLLSKSLGFFLTHARMPIEAVGRPDERNGHCLKLSAIMARSKVKKSHHHQQEPRPETGQDSLMNADLPERFRGPARTPKNQVDDPLDHGRRVYVLNPSIRKYAAPSTKPYDGADWTTYPDYPSSDEIWDCGRNKHDQDIELDVNQVVGPYASKLDYLERHYRLLREDAVAPLRDAVSEIQCFPGLLERDSCNDAFIYERVYITGYTFAFVGLATRLIFSTARAGKLINWEQSKRLLTGTILALTPAKDCFQTVCRLAVVAARPLAGLQERPPTIDVFFVDETEIDPQQEWIMVEARQGFYEGHRHVLAGLQKLTSEP